jgi:hypothetical protein
MSVAEAELTPTVDARKIAWWAEEAHGRQGKPLYVVLGRNGRPTMTDAPGKGQRLLLKVEASGFRQALVRPHRLTMEITEGRVVDLLDDAKTAGCDALFWTVSSIEKFLFPYYYSQRLFSNAQMSNFRTEYETDRILVAAAHRAPSRVRLYFANSPDEPEINFMDLGPEDL